MDSTTICTTRVTLQTYSELNAGISPVSKNLESANPRWPLPNQTTPRLALGNRSAILRLQPRDSSQPDFPEASIRAHGCTIYLHKFDILILGPTKVVTLQSILLYFMIYTDKKWIENLAFCKQLWSIELGENLDDILHEVLFPTPREWYWSAWPWVYSPTPYS